MQFDTVLFFSVWQKSSLDQYFGTFDVLPEFVADADRNNSKYYLLKGKQVYLEQCNLDENGNNKDFISRYVVDNVSSSKRKSRKMKSLTHVHTSNTVEPSCCSEGIRILQEFKLYPDRFSEIVLCEEVSDLMSQSIYVFLREGLQLHCIVSQSNQRLSGENSIKEQKSGSWEDMKLVTFMPKLCFILDLISKVSRHVHKTEKEENASKLLIMMGAKVHPAFASRWRPSTLTLIGQEPRDHREAISYLEWAIHHYQFTKVRSNRMLQ